MSRRLVLFAGVIGLGLGIFLYPLMVLTLTTDDRVVFCRIVRPGDTFQLAFLHSIALSEVRDTFVIDGEYRIVLTETRFQGQGTGIPTNPSPGEQLLREGDWFRITGMKRQMPSVSWRVQSQWNNRFRFGGGPETDLSSKLGDALIRIQVQRISPAAFLVSSLQTEKL